MSTLLGFGLYIGAASPHQTNNNTYAMQGTWFVFHRSRHSFQVVHAYSWKETQTKKENAQVKEADSYFSQEQRSNQQVNIPNSAPF